MAFKRWYDVDIRVSTVVRTMEFLNLPSQQKFAKKLLQLSEEILSSGEYTPIEPEKEEGLKKSKAKNRWYDRYETLHHAFNNLYILSKEDRREIASQLSVPIKIVEGYERHCKRGGHEPDMKVVEEILRTCFQEGSNRAMRLYGLYLVDPTPRASVRKEASEDSPKSMLSSLLHGIQNVLSVST